MAYIYSISQLLELANSPLVVVPEAIRDLDVSLFQPVPRVPSRHHHSTEKGHKPRGKNAVGNWKKPAWDMQGLELAQPTIKQEPITPEDPTALSPARNQVDLWEGNFSFQQKKDGSSRFSSLFSPSAPQPVPQGAPQVAPGLGSSQPQGVPRTGAPGSATPSQDGSNIARGISQSPLDSFSSLQGTLNSGPYGMFSSGGGAPSTPRGAQSAKMPSSQARQPPGLAPHSQQGNAPLQPPGFPAAMSQTPPQPQFPGLSAHNGSGPQIPHQGMQAMPAPPGFGMPMGHNNAPQLGPQSSGSQSGSAATPMSRKDTSTSDVAFFNSLLTRSQPPVPVGAPTTQRTPSRSNVMPAQPTFSPSPNPSHMPQPMGNAHNSSSPIHMGMMPPGMPFPGQQHGLPNRPGQLGQNIAPPQFPFPSPQAPLQQQSPRHMFNQQTPVAPPPGVQWDRPQQPQHR